MATTAYTTGTAVDMSGDIVTTTAIGVGANNSIPGSVAPVQILAGGGTPIGSVTGNIGWVYINTSGASATNRLFVNTSNGSTTWTSITTST